MIDYALLAASFRIHIFALKDLKVNVSAQLQLCIVYFSCSLNEVLVGTYQETPLHRSFTTEFYREKRLVLVLSPELSAGVSAIAHFLPLIKKPLLRMFQSPVSCAFPVAFSNRKSDTSAVWSVAPEIGLFVSTSLDRSCLLDLI